MIYSFRGLLDKQPVTISAAVFAVLNVLVTAGVFTVDSKTLAAANVALVLVLGLFVNSKTANTAVLSEIADTTDQAAQTAARETVKQLRPRVPAKAPEAAKKR
jgi:hypothetical protein